jgi:hypothetical protein
MDQRWYGCTTSMDCPSGMICASQVNMYPPSYGEVYTECRATVGDNNWNNESCEPSMPASQCVTNSTCYSFGGSSTDPLTGECL